MRVAIHQPYLFPYIGYFQLIHAVDTFVFYDDVKFIRGGWIHRNRLLVNDEPSWFTLPLETASSALPINRRRIDLARLERWSAKLRRTLELGYARSPQLDVVLSLVEDTLAAAPRGLAAVAQRSVELTCDYLGIDTPLVVASRIAPAGDEAGASRVMDVCVRAGGTHYINASGGRGLYDDDDFRQAGLGLSFLEPDLTPYDQTGPVFEPRLSVLDLLLCADQTEARTAVRRYDVAEVVAPPGRAETGRE